MVTGGEEHGVANFKFGEFGGLIQTWRTQLGLGLYGMLGLRSHWCRPVVPWSRTLHSSTEPEHRQKFLAEPLDMVFFCAEILFPWLTFDQNGFLLILAVWRDQIPSPGCQQNPLCMPASYHWYPQLFCSTTIPKFAIEIFHRSTAYSCQRLLCL